MTDIVNVYHHIGRYIMKRILLHMFAGLIFVAGATLINPTAKVLQKLVDLTISTLAGIG